jgi:hypothetical protein
MPQSTDGDQLRLPGAADARIDSGRSAGSGVRPGGVLLVHSSLRALGWVSGGPLTVVHALLDLLGPDGTLVVPSQTADNRDPSTWTPPPPEAWWPAFATHCRASIPSGAGAYGWE